MVRVLITVDFSDEQLAKLRAVSPELEIEQMERLRGEWPADKEIEAEILYVAGAVPPPEQAPSLRWVQVHWAGVDKLLDHPIWDSDVLITSASGVHAPNLAQYVMAQILAWAHRVPRWLHFQRQGTWPDQRWERFVPDEVHGKTIGIAGYGSIGREVARLAHCFGMTVLATKRDVQNLEEKGYLPADVGDRAGVLPDHVYPPAETREMVASCDYVVNTLPLTEETYHFFDEALLRAMKPSAFFVNVGRGATVKEDDLVRALQEGWIAGAGLDVFEQEPLPEDSPLWQMDNVILSPHVGGFTRAYDERTSDLFAENLRRYLNDEPLLNLVEREAGY